MQNGHSLIESLMVLLLIAILGTLAAPNLQLWQARQRLQAAANMLHQDIGLARYQAVIQQREISIRPRVMNCWACGWRVFPTNQPDVAIVERSASQTITIGSNSPWQNGADYQPNGAAEQVSGAFAAGTLILCTRGLNQQARIIISRSGRARRGQSSQACL